MLTAFGEEDFELTNSERYLNAILFKNMFLSILGEIKTI